MMSESISIMNELILNGCFCNSEGFPDDSVLKKICLPIPANEETQVPSLGQEDPLEKEMKTHFNILAWEIAWTAEFRGLWSMESQESDMT